MYEYRANIRSSEAAANATLHLDCWVQRRLEDPPDPDVNPWVNVPLGHRTVVLQASAVQVALNSGATDPQKRAAIVALLRQEILGWGIDEADQAEQGLMELVPGENWPMAVPL